MAKSIPWEKLGPNPNSWKIEQSTAIYTDQAHPVVLLLFIVTHGVGFFKDNYLLHRMAKTGEAAKIRYVLETLNCGDRGILLAKVDEKGRKLEEVTNHDEVQEVIANIRGHYYTSTPITVLIVCMTKDRPGAELERDSLMNVLQDFNVHVQIRFDLTRAKLLQAIREQQNSPVPLSGQIVIIMSHGQRGAVHAADGPIDINHILLQMNISSLEGKPKVRLT